MASSDTITSVPSSGQDSLSILYHWPRHGTQRRASMTTSAARTRRRSASGRRRTWSSSVRLAGWLAAGPEQPWGDRALPCLLRAEILRLTPGSKSMPTTPAAPQALWAPRLACMTAPTLPGVAAAVAFCQTRVFRRRTNMTMTGMTGMMDARVRSHGWAGHQRASSAQPLLPRCLPQPTHGLPAQAPERQDSLVPCQARQRGGAQLNRRASCALAWRPSSWV